MTTDERITAYRSAAAKLGEALAEGDQERAYLATVNALVPLDDGGETAANAYRGVACCSDWAAYRANPRGWRWITAAARLRLLAEALILEQQDRIEEARREGWQLDLGYQAELGSLVREVLKGETP